MKYLFIFLYPFIILNHAYTQPEKPFVADRGRMPGGYENMVTIDSSNIRVWYAMNATDIHNTDTYYDWQRLEIGKNLSKYYSFWVYNSDSLIYEHNQKNKNASVGFWVMGGPYGRSDYRWSEYICSSFCKYFSSNTLVVFSAFPRMWRGPRGSRYTETIPVQDWVLHEDTLTVAGQLCQKASCRFRGRNFEAWFAPDIPISNGPWKFGGLPGLILKVYDTDNLYTFECTKIEIYSRKFPIKINDEKYFNTQVDRKKLLKLHHDIHVNYPRAASITTFSYPDEGPYHPLELE